MGNSESNIPDISSDKIRQHRGNLASKAKKDYKDMLQRDRAIQKIYKKLHPKEGYSSYQDEEDEDEDPESPVEPMVYDEEFYRRYDDVETVKKVLFTPDTTLTPANDLSEKIDEAEYKNDNDSFPIKLYIAEPSRAVKENAKHLDRKVKLAVNNKFVGLWGLAHAALQIGDKMVHFLDNHFVKIDTFKAGQALLLLNVSESGRLPKNDQVKTTIAEVIVEWNKNYRYNKATRNCQDFVEQMCLEIEKKCQLRDSDKFNLSFKNNPVIRAYMENLIKNPEVTGFHITFKDEFISFETHAELDKWEAKHWEEFSEEQKAFLKGFHRAFQLRYADAELHKDQDDMERYAKDPYEGCTRGNPTLD